MQLNKSLCIYEGNKKENNPDHSEPKVIFKLIITELYVAVQLNQLGFFFK